MATELMEAVRAARTLVAEVVGDPPTGSVAECAALVGELQVLVNVATAAQDAAIVALAAVETEVAEDGTLVESRRAPGHVALDAPAIVSGVLCVSAVHAERRVRDAVRRAADGPASDPSTGLGGLHAAMAAGRLDAYRAGVVAHELEEVPDEVAASVVSAVGAFLDHEDGPRLRRRVRRVLARISPDLLRQRAVRARSESSLQRWVDEPGVDTWHGTFPSEEACRAWAAIDALAQEYVADGTCERVDQARAKALTDLVIGQATIDLQVVLTTPATTPTPTSEPAASGPAAPTDLVEVGGLRPGDPVLVDRGWLQQAVEQTVAPGRDRRLPCDTRTGAPTDPTGDLTTSAYRPTTRLVAFVRARDQHCRFPGCHVAARFCDLDHVRPFPAGPTSAENLACLCRRHHRIKQRPGWTATIHPDASMTWTDPTGRVRTTHPPDRLHPIVLPDSGTDPSSPIRGVPSLAIPDGPHSALEHHLEHQPVPAWTCRVHTVRPRVALTYAPLRDHEHQPRHRLTVPDTPPF